MPQIARHPLLYYDFNVMICAVITTSQLNINL